VCTSSIQIAFLQTVGLITEDYAGAGISMRCQRTVTNLQQDVAAQVQDGAPGGRLE